MTWLILSLIGRTGFAACNILDSHFSNVHFKSPYAQTFFFNLFFIILLPLYYFICGVSSVPLDLWPWMIVGGLSFFFYVVPYLQSLKISDASTVASLFTLGRALVPPLAFVLIGETLSINETIGFAIVLGGASWHAYDPSKSKMDSRLLLLMGLSGILTAICAICGKKIFDVVDWASGTFYLMAIDLVICMMLLLVKPLRPELIDAAKLFPKMALSYSPIVVFSLIGNIFLFWALSLTKVSYIAMTAQFQSFIALGLGYILSKVGRLENKESFSKEAMTQKLLGFCIMAIGMAIALLL